MRAYLRHFFKWLLLTLLLLGVCGLLLQTDHPVLTALPLGLYVLFYVRDTMRFLRPLRGKIIRRVDGYVENPRNVRRTIASTVVAVAVACLFAVFGFYVLLVLLAVIIASVLLEPLAIRHGWFAEGRITARLHRQRFIDERFRGSVDPRR